MIRRIDSPASVFDVKRPLALACDPSGGRGGDISKSAENSGIFCVVRTGPEKSRNQKFSFVDSSLF